MSEFTGLSSVAEGMVWVGGGSSGCEHRMDQREVTVEGGVGCANCGALLLPAEDVRDGLERAVASERQVKYRLKGRLPGQISGALSLVGEWDDPEAAIACARHINDLGGHSIVLKITAEEVETGV